MNSFIDKLAQKRLKLLEALDANEGDINLDIFEDFYPDQAHFVFELLQNAEDAGATDANFILSAEGCRFVHNGTREFTEDDVRAITGIHNSTKDKATDQIGKFGVGFKSVFVYTLSPSVYSGDYSFRISRLVMPESVEPDRNARGKTSFWLPFNNPKKAPEAAYIEIEAGLRELAETTLLFLTHLESIRWEIADGSSGEVCRIKNSEYHFEVLKQSGGMTTASSHFLKFDNPVEGLEKQRIAVAFALDFLPEVQQFDSEKPLATQLKVTPAMPGLVAVFFPADKETSGLRFHLHAPFVPELSRASIKETPVNQPLFGQLATLTAASLHRIRDLGLLTADFLAVLPNPQDPLRDRYKGIRTSIIEEMNSKSLTPTYAKSHSPARLLLQAKASLKELLAENDLELLVKHKMGSFQWAIGAAQKNSNTDRFLSGLAITQWDINDFVELIGEKSSEGQHYISVSPHLVQGPDDVFMNWLSLKPMEWHQKLYDLLHSELSPSGEVRRLTGRRIVRLSNGEYSVGSKCFFPSEEVEHDDALPRVDRAVYSSGKSKPQQERARKFLESIGVREVGEVEQIEAILTQRYTRENFKPAKQDLERFIRLVEKEPQRAVRFANYFIFEGGDGKWRQPARVYLDQPFMDTGLSVYYPAIGTNTQDSALAESYQECGVSMKRIAKFAEAVGARTHLEITQTDCSANPQRTYLHSAFGDRRTSPIDRDFIIVGIGKLLENPTPAVSKLIWRTMGSLPNYPNYLLATYQMNNSWGAREAASQLVHHLRKAAWVPQGNGSFVRPAEASRNLLPDGFSFDPGWPWLKVIEFGQDAVKQTEAQREKQILAKELGFEDDESLELALLFAAVPKDERKRFLSERGRAVELPKFEPADPENREKNVRNIAETAPEKGVKERLQPVSGQQGRVKARTAKYLRKIYTRDGSEMICQVCKTALPFKLDNGRAYFEKVQFLPDLTKYHFQNYLALCPNHAAMFRHVNGSKETIREAFITLTGAELEIVLAQKVASIYFTSVHIKDLKTMIAYETEEQDEGNC